MRPRIPSPTHDVENQASTDSLYRGRKKKKRRGDRSRSPSRDRLAQFSKPKQTVDAALALKAHDVKGLLRRAKAYIGRHEYARARADLEQVKELEPWNAEAEAVLAGLKEKAKAERGAERALFKGCLDQY